MTTQCEAILKHLQTRGTLTPIDALNEYGIFRLAARVLELRDSGHDIVTIRESQGEKVFARYLLRSNG
jgi:hypothetical protein